MENIQVFFANLDNTLNQVLSNPYVTAVVSLFVILYAGMAAPELPPMIAGLFDFTLFKMLVLALILLINNYNPTIAILVAVGFFISLQTLSRYRLFNMAGEVFNLKALMGRDGGNAEAEGEEGAMNGEGEAMAGSKYGYGPEDQVMDYNEGPGVNTQVSGLVGRTSDFQGPQGMEPPFGFGGVVEGAELQ